MRVSGTKNAGCGLGDGSEGVGEHVRTRFHKKPKAPVKLRTQGIRTERRNLFLLPDRFLIENTVLPLT